VKGGYHSPNKIKGIKYWETQSDSSLRIKDDKYNTSIEITSIPFRDEETDLVIADFKKIFGEGELNDFFECNNSCGMHIHFTPTTKVMEKNTYPAMAEFLRNKAIVMFTRLTETNEMTVSEMVEHYDRGYASKWTSLPKDMLLSPTTRGDINFNGYPSKGYEWRSPHILGVKTWKEFEDYIKGYLEILKSMETEKIQNIPIELISEIPLTAKYYKPRGQRRYGRTRYTTVNVIPMNNKKYCPLMKKSEVNITLPTEEELECVISI
jgi:hypothetical protein